MNILIGVVIYILVMVVIGALVGFNRLGDDE